jgi:hypothetical protein
MSSFESFVAKASRRGRRMSTRPSLGSLPSSQATASAKARWISRPMIPDVCSSVSVRSKRELAGNMTSTDPRSRRIRETRKGRPYNELGLSAHCLSGACPHLRAPGAPGPAPGTSNWRGTMRKRASSRACRRSGMWWTRRSPPFAPTTRRGRVQGIAGRAPRGDGPDVLKGLREGDPNPMFLREVR